MIFDVPVITSRSHLDCGATCLKMLLDYYGLEAPSVHDLATEMHTGMTGCTGRDLKDIGNKYGLDIKGYNADVDDVYSCDRPCIVHWRKAHFLIYCGIDTDGRVLVIDPDKGKYHMPRAIFNTYYSGVAFTNGEPGEIPVEQEYSVNELINILLGGESNE